MEVGSPSGAAWADLAEQDLPPPREFFAGSPGLLREILDHGPLERVALSDSEDLSESERSFSPPPEGKGKGVVAQGCCRRRVRRHRNRRRPAGFMAAARRSHPSPSPERSWRGPSPCWGHDPRHSSPAARHVLRSSSPTAHPVRAWVVLDEDGFFRVQSCRFGRSRTPPRSPRKVPQELDGVCFRCLAPGHTKVVCSFPEKCYNCWAEGHRAATCPFSPRRGEA